MQGHAQTKGQIKTLDAINANIAACTDIVNTKKLQWVLFVMETMSANLEIVMLKILLAANSALENDKSK